MKKFKIVNTCQELTPDHPSPRIFLAGCTARPGQTVTWRKESLELFELYNFEGTLIIPEVAEGSNWHDFQYKNICGWEHEMMDKSDIILFWIPRNIETGVLGLTSNVEFGRAMEKYPSKVFYGRPEGSDSTRYLDWYYEHYCWPRFIQDDLKSLIFYSINYHPSKGSL